MGNRHPHNPDSCDIVVETSAAVHTTSLPQEVSESAHVTPVRCQKSSLPSKKRNNDNIFQFYAMSTSPSSRSDGAGPSSTSNSGQSPLKFHHIHGENVRLTNDQRNASRTDSFCRALAFSDRPIGVNELVCLRFAEVKTTWSGVLRFGVTNLDPVTISNNLPKYACPDMTNKEGTWAKAMAERYCQQGNIMQFFVQENGDMYYGINGNLRGLFLSGISLRAPIFVVVDIYGNTTSVEFVNPSDAPPLSRRTRDGRSAVPPPPRIPLPPIPLYAGPEPVAESVPPACPPPVAECPPPVADSSPPAPVIPTPTPTPTAPIPLPVAPLAAPEPSSSPRQQSIQRPDNSVSLARQQLTRELEQRLSFAEIQRRSLSGAAASAPGTSAPTTASVSSTAGTAAAFRTNEDATPLIYNKNLPIIPLQFHITRGRTVSLNSDRTIATRIETEYCGGYVFTARPMRCMEKAIIQILGVAPQYSGGLGFGVTNCSPAELVNFEFPDDADELLNRLEFWAVNKDYEREPKVNDELTYYITENGEVIYQKNNITSRILMHVDPSLTYFMFFDIYGSAKRIRCVGSTDGRLSQDTTPVQPTIPQRITGPTAQPTLPQRRRQGHQAPNPHGPYRRAMNQAQPPMDAFPDRPLQPAAVLQQFAAYQRSSGFTLPPQPDVPRRGDTGRPEVTYASSSTAHQQSFNNGPRPVRYFDNNHGRHGFGGPPPRPNRPPPAVPQRTVSVPTAQAMANVSATTTTRASASQMPRPASMTAVGSFGAGSSAAAASTAASSDSGGTGARECCICMDHVADSAVYPCGHMCMCYGCGTTTRQRQGVCPICRKPIQDILRLYPQ